MGGQGSGVYKRKRIAAAIKPKELRKLREGAGMTPTDLGAAIGVSARTIDRLEAGVTRITRLHLKAIMAVLESKPAPSKNISVPA